MGSGGGNAREVADFEVRRLGVEDETDERGGAVESLYAGGAGVDVEKAVLVVVHDAEDVAVATDEDVGLGKLEGAPELVGIVTGVAADVAHEDALALNFEEELLVELVMEAEAVAVAPDGPDGLELAKLVEDIGADVAGMPKLVAVAEEGEDLRGKVAVGVGENAYASHGAGFGCVNAPVLFIGLNLAEVFGDHLAEVVDDVYVVERHVAQGLAELVGVELEGVDVGGVGDDEVDVLMGGEEEDEGAGEVAHGGTVPMVVLEPEFEACADTDLAGDVHAAAAVFGVHLDQRQSEADLARGAAGGVGVGDAGEEFGRHAAAVVLYGKMEDIVLEAVADGERNEGGIGGCGVFHQVVDMHGEFFHGGRN